jgi:ELWxxDGT repeat protein/VCBS repeat-containing protein
MPDIAGNTLGTATLLNLTSAVQTLSDTATLTGNDFYRFTLSYRSSLNATLTGLSANANITLLDRDGNPVNLGGVTQSSNNASTFAESINTPLDAGVYYLRVAPESSTPSVNYTLNLSIANDLTTDLVWRNYADGTNATWQLAGLSLSSITPLPAIADLDWQVQTIGDLNRDGSSDLILRNQRTGEDAVWYLNGATFVGLDLLDPVADTNWQIQGSGDFNGDGKTDLIWRNQSSGDNVIWYLDGKTLLGLDFLSPVADTNWRIQATGDFNRDGKTDLIWRNQSSGDNVVWYLDGKTFLGLAFLPPVADTNWQIQGSGDFNRDGKADLVLRNYSTGDNAVWYLDGIALAGIELLPPVADITWGVQSPLVRVGTPPTIDTAGNSIPTAFNVGSNLRGNANYRGAIAIPDADDYYQFAVANRANLTLGLTGLTADLNLQLLSADGTVVQASAQTGTTPESIVRSLEAGTYYARVFTDGGSNSPYNLGISLGSVPVLVTNRGLTLTEGGIASLGSSLLQVTDPDVTTVQVVYTLGSAPTVGSLSLNGAALVAGSQFTQADLDAGTRLSYQHNGSETTADSFSFTVTDGIGGTIASTPFTIGVTPVNDRPVLTVPTATQAADQLANTPIGGIRVTDVDAATGEVTATLTANNGLLSLSTIAGLRLTQGTGMGDPAVIFSGSLSAVNAALATLFYRSNATFGGTDTINLQVNDNGNTGLGGPLTDSKTISVQVTPINRPPSITLPAPLSVREDTSQTITGISISDPDAGGGNITASLSVLNGVVSLGSVAGVSVTTGTGTRDRNVVLSGPIGAINAALANLSYLGNPNFFGSDSIQISVSDNGNTGNGVPLSDQRSLSILVSPVNDAPVLTVPTEPQSAGENTTLSLGGISVQDVDAGSGNLTVSLSAINGGLSVAAIPGVTFSGTGSQGSSIIFSGTLLAVNSALATLNYRGNLNYSGDDTLTIDVSDNGNTGSGIALNDQRTIAINVLAFNSPPVIALPPAPAVNTATNAAIAGISISDPDAGTGNALVTIAAPDGILTVQPDPSITFLQGTSNTGGRLTFQGSLAAINQTLATLVYRSNPGFVGFERLTISVNDQGNTGIGTSLSDTKTLFVSVGGAVNQVPIALNDTASVAEGGSLSGTSVLGNDRDPDNNVPLSAQLGTGPLNAASFTLNPDGTFSYVPKPFFNGTDSFTYSARDQLGGVSTPATVTIAVTSVNDPPIANNDSFNVNEDEALPGNVISNDTDPDNNLPLTAQVVTGPANALSFTLNPNGTFTYTPRANFNGSDSFVYRVSDSAGGLSNPATANIVVAAVNDAPIAVNDNYSVTSAGVITPATGVLANDTDAEPGTSLTAKLVDSTKNGSLTFNTVTGTFTYTPTTGFTGTDSFTYRANDGTLDSANTATVTLVVGSATNNAPIAVNDTYSVTSAGVITPNTGVLVNDTDADPGTSLTAKLVDTAKSGSLTFNTVTGTFTYTPNTGFTGTDSFTYRANDGALDSANTATVTLIVGGTNSAPIAANDTYRNAITGQPFVVSSVLQGVLNNDTDAQNDPRTAIKVSDGQNGSVTLNPNGTFTYTPTSPTFAGTDSFTYKANDGLLDSNTATVTIVVAPNTAPNAVDDSYKTSNSRLLTIDTVRGLLANDTDTESGFATTARTVTSPSNGVLSLNPNGSFTYQANSTFVGTDSFTYRSSDGTLDSTRTATVLITVVANTAPTAANDTYSTSRNRRLTPTALEGVLRNDTDAEGDPLTATVVSTTQNGSLTLNTVNGSFDYTPTPGFAGTDSFTYRVSDGALNSGTATAVITVLPNSAPVANSETYFFNTGQARTIPARGVLTNDTDADGNSLTLSPVSSAVNGILSSNPDGSFTYTPDSGFTGTDSFTYRVSDGTLTSDSLATATLIVAANAAPVTTADSFTVNRNGTLPIAPSRNVLANDTDVDALTASVVTGPTGSLVLNPDGTFSYTPTTGFTGTDSFTYRASDGTLSSIGTAFITVNAASGAPTAVADTYSDVNTNSPYTVTVGRGVLTNDTDPENDRLFATIGTQATRGSVTLNADGSFVYAPTTANFIGTDSFTYTATDGINTTNPTTVTLVVGAVNNAPVVVVPGSQLTFQGTDLIIPSGLGVSDVDAGTNPISVTLSATSGNLSLSTTTNLTVTNNGSQSITLSGTQADINAALVNFKYRPLSDIFTGTDLITVTANDGGFTGGTSLTPKTGTGTVTVNVTAGATIVRDINSFPLPTSSTESSNPTNLTTIGSTVFFVANDGLTGTEVWKSDGTDAGTTLVADVNPDGDSTANNLTLVGSTLFFTADNGVNGTELWKIDPATGQATIVKDIRTGVPSSNPTNLVNFNGTLYFRANDGSGQTLWKSDGTEAGTLRLPGTVSSPGSLTVAGNSLFFTVNSGAELWRSDGSTAGARIPTTGTTGPITNLTAIGNSVFFTVPEAGGLALWSSNGSTASRLSPLSSTPSFSPNLVTLGDTIYFFTKTATGTTLSKSTAAGAVSTVQTLPAGAIDPTSLTVVGSSLYFVVDTGTAGAPKQQLWRSDGTTASLVKDINPTGNAAPTSLTNLNGTLAFVATDATGIKLWRSDGTATGTIPISAAFTAGAPTGLKAVGNKLFFTADTGTSGIELWAL